MNFRVLVFILILLNGLSLAQDPTRIKIVPGGETRLGIADFAPKTSANPETQKALTTFNKVLFDDLKFSAFFEIPSKSFYPLKPLRTPQDVMFEHWQVPTLDVDFLAFGTLQADATITIVEAYLFDVKTKQQIMGKRYTVNDPALIRRIAHEFADRVVYELSAAASQGVARTQIAFSSLREGNKEIWIMDYDGSNARQVSFTTGLNKFPEWSPDGNKLVYTSLQKNRNRWELRVQDLEGGTVPISLSGSYISSPAFGPNGQMLAFSARTENSLDSDIFVSRTDGSGARNLTNTRGIDTSPTWSPTGTQIAFISDRSGSPQVWVMDSDGSNVRRLVVEGGHCDSPDWSPDGRHILYSWQAPRQWDHDVYIVEVATGRVNQLSTGMGSSESPHWSPDGRHIVFQSTRSGTKQVFIMNVNGDNLKQVTAYGINESPSWGNYLPVGAEMP